MLLQYKVGERERKRGGAHLHSGVRRSREHVDANRRLCHSQNGHNANMAIESAVMVERGSVVDLEVLVVSPSHQEPAGHRQRVDGSELSFHLSDEAEVVAGSPDVESVVCGAVEIVLCGR